MFKITEIDQSKIIFNQPQDIFGIGIKNILNYRKNDPKFKKLVINWNKTIVFEFPGLYPITINFNGNTININYGDSEKYDLRVIMPELSVMTEIARGDLGPISGFLKGKIKIKKMFSLPVLIRFIKIFIPALHIAGERAKWYKKNKLKRIRLKDDAPVPPY
ncbi:MAG: SCP2 sterol-binding domain-containing protein [Promethearchaeota archaeon]